MLTDIQRRAAAESLLDSHRTKVQGTRPSEAFPEIEIEDSYAISSMIAQMRQDDGARIIGHKIGLTSRRCRPHPRLTSRITAISLMTC